MNKNFKVIQINGLSGLLLLGVILTGLICGFVLFPIWIIMTGWNEVIAQTFNGPHINYLQAALLWSIIALSLFMGLKNSVSFRVKKAADSKNIKDINEVELNDIVNNSDDFEQPAKSLESEEKTEVQEVKNEELIK